MKGKLVQNRKLSPKWMRFFCVVILALGVFFRFVNLDHRVYWSDEVYTSIRISGYTTAELVQQVFDGHVHSVEDLQKYQHINSERGVIDTVKGLIVEEPQLSPLYFVVVRFWAQWFGDSVAAIRSLSVLISLLAFPCIYWLCQELFEWSLVGWVAIALLAVSPFHVLYAQDARPYSLWTVTILLSSAQMLRAMRLNTKFSWIIYSATVALGLYSYLFSGLIVIGHGIYIVTTEGFRCSKRVTAYLLASLSGLVTFAPWLWVFMTYFINAKSSTKPTNAVSPPLLNLDLLSLSKHWFGYISRIFIDLNLTVADTVASKYFIIPTLILLVLVAYSLYFVCRKTPKRVWLFLVTLTGTTTVFLVLLALTLGQPLSDIPARYLIPSFIGIEISTSYFLSVKTTSIFLKSQQQKLWRFVMAILVAGGIFSCILISQAEAWWNVHNSSCNPPSAHIINQSTYPLLISDADGGKFDSAASNVISLSYLLNSKVKLQLLVPHSVFRIPKGFSDVFLFTPSEGLRDELGKGRNYRLKPVYEGQKSYRNSKVCLWTLERQ